MLVIEQPNRSECTHRCIDFLPCVLAGFVLLAALLLAACLFPHQSFADSSASEDNAADARWIPDDSLRDTSICDLDNADSSYQGKTVQVTGEVVGDAIRAEEDLGRHWIVLDDISGREGSVSVLVDDCVLNEIDTYGAYGE